MSLRSISNWSFTDYVLREPLQQIYDGKEHWWYRSATMLSLVPLAFDTALNFVIDTLYFLKDGAAGLGRIAQARWQRQPFSPLKVSFGQFISFCKEHFAFTYTCAEVLVKGLVLSWWHPQRYLAALSKVHTQIDTQRSHTLFCSQVKSLKSLVDSLRVIESLDQTIRKFNELIAALPKNSPFTEQEAGELLYALHDLPQTTRDRLQLETLCQQMPPLAAVAAVKQVFQRYTPTGRYRPGIVQCQQFTALIAFLESFACFAHQPQIATRIVALAAQKAYDLSDLLLAQHIADFYENRGIDVKAIRFYPLNKEQREETEAIGLAHLQATGTFAQLTKGFVEQWPPGLPQLILEYADEPLTEIRLCVSIQQWLTHPSMCTAEKIEKLHRAYVSTPQRISHGIMGYIILQTMLPANEMSPLARQAALHFYRVVQHKAKQHSSFGAIYDVNRALLRTKPHLEWLLNQAERAASQQAIKLLHLNWELLAYHFELIADYDFRHIIKYAKEILKRMAQLDYSWLMDLQTNPDIEEVRLFSLRYSHYGECWGSQELLALGQQLRIKANHRHSAEAAMILALLPPRAENRVRFATFVTKTQMWESAPDKRKQIEPFLILNAVDAFRTTQNPDRLKEARLILAHLADFMLRNETANSQSPLIQWLQQQFKKLWSNTQGFTYFKEALECPQNLKDVEHKALAFGEEDRLLTRIIQAQPSSNLETFVSFTLPPTFKKIMRHDHFLLLWQRIRAAIEFGEIETTEIPTLIETFLGAFEAFLRAPQAQAPIDQEQWKNKILKEGQWFRSYYDTFASSQSEHLKLAHLRADTEALLLQMRMDRVLLKFMEVKHLIEDASQSPLGQRSSSPVAHTPP